MADEYIRREDAKDALQEKVFHNLTDEFYGAMQAIDELPSADVAPVVHAHWIDTFQAENGYYMGICSHCYLPNIVSLYCGKCGAKMDEEAKNE